MYRLPAIYPTLLRLRWAAKSLYAAGFESQAIEMMRVSRGEVLVRGGQTLFGMTPADMAAARTCVTLEKQLWATERVLAKNEIQDEDEKKGPQGWPVGRTKDETIATDATHHNYSAASLERFMDRGDTPRNLEDFVKEVPRLIIHPDWHPDRERALFSKE